MSATYIYFVRPIGGGPVKIGRSKTPLKRFQLFAGWSPVPMELAAKAPGRMRDELHIHRIFKEYRMHGEWFAPNQPLDNLIAHVATHGALPVKFVCGFVDAQQPGLPRKSGKLDQYLTDKNLTALAFADLINRAPSTITRLLSGRHTPDASTMKAIIDATDGAVTPNDFFELPGSPAPETAEATQ